MKAVNVFIIFLCLQLNLVCSHPKLNSLHRWRKRGLGKKLYEVAEIGDKNSVIQLIQSGVYIDEKDSSGRSALFLAALNGHSEIVDLLIQRGANIDLVDEYMITPLTSATAAGHYEIVEKLIRKGANIEHQNRIHDTPLMLATDKGFSAIADLLIRSQANVNHANSKKDTALMLAANKGYDELIMLLIRKGANVNLVNLDGNTALHLAAFNGHARTAELLMQGGADRTIKNRNGKLAKDLAIENGHTKIYELLAINIISKKTVAERACEVYSSNLTNRISGGSPAESGELPWMAALGYLNQDYKISFDCGGTLISDSFVLTAGHCVRDSRRPVVVRLGKFTLTDDDGNRALNQQIQEIIRHPNYSNIDKKNDIALLRLVNRVYFTEQLKPACLQTDLRDESRNVNLTVSGWGIVNLEWRNRSKILQKTNLQTMPLAECNSVLLNYNRDKMLAAFQNGVSDSQYCANDPYRWSDSCEGDSGGPLQIIQNDQALAKIVGVVSFGIGCGSPLPGIYTRVAYYRDWIESYVWPNGEITT